MKSIAKPTYKTIIFRNVALVLYLVIGGAVFQLCEKQHYISSSNRYKQVIKSFRKRYNITAEDMQHLQDILHNGRISTANEWSYSNAVFFAGTTVLTVGYGNLVPKTTQGRAFCIIYAIIGIPIACLALKSIAERIMVAEVFLITSAYKCIWREKRVRAVHMKASILNVVLTVVFILLLAGVAKLKRREWSYFECIYFSVITFTTIGFGDYIPIYQHSFNEFDVLTLILGFFIGFAFVSCLLCSLSYALEEHSSTVLRKARTTIEHKTGKKFRSQTLESIEIDSFANGHTIKYHNELGNSTGITLQKYSTFNTERKSSQ